VRYLVDGYNVMHRCARLKGRMRDNLEGARDELVDRVARYCSTTGDQAMVVFDAAGRVDPRDHRIPAYAGVEVVYSRARHSADTIIERHVYRAASTRGLCVITADGGIRDFCRALGAAVMHPDHFLKEIDETTQRSSTQRVEAQRKDRLGGLETRLERGETAYLKELKRRLAKDQNTKG
jgi:predicted RNA-binding protein with PIN domain